MSICIYSLDAKIYYIITFFIIHHIKGTMMLQKLTLELPLMKVKNVCAQTHYYKISLGYSCIVYVRSASFDQIWEQIRELKH